MRLNKKLVAGLATLLLLGCGLAAAADLNEVGALLVFPAVTTFNANNPAGLTETFMTITNTGANDVVAHGSFIDGSMDPNNNNFQSCQECNFSIPLTGADTEVLVLTQTPTGVSIESLDNTISRNCNWNQGMIVISLEDPAGQVSTANLLFGEQIVANYTNGWAFSIPAIPFQGIAGVGGGDRVFGLNDVEYKGFPRRLAADFLAPRDDTLPPIFVAEVVLFTLGFETNNAVQNQVDCRLNGFDAAENPFTSGRRFTCWDFFDLCDQDSEFCYPNLGVGVPTPNNPANFDSHGWVSFDCEVGAAKGGVHGAIVQVAAANTPLRPPGGGVLAGGWAAWGRLLYQSATTGDPVTFIANPAPPPPGGFN
ncbi:MAG: hypothetical protein GY716_10850 [bacterium]|nr:hypothetical protein [bacterium]